MGKTRELFKKIRDTKGTFHAKMGSIKDRNCMDLTEAEDIKKRWQEYTELYKKDLHDSDNHDGVITHLEPDILEYEVKWALICIRISQEEGKVVWFSYLLKNVPQFVVIHIVKGLGIINKAEEDDFLGFCRFFNDSTGIGNLISGFSAFAKSSLNIWNSRFMYH